MSSGVPRGLGAGHERAAIEHPKGAKSSKRGEKELHFSSKMTKYHGIVSLLLVRENFSPAFILHSTCFPTIYTVEILVVLLQLRLMEWITSWLAILRGFFLND
jgi:hypothetical protein